MLIRSQRIFVLILLALVAGGLLFPRPVAAQKEKDLIIRLQADVDRLTQAQRDLQRAVDEKHAVLKTLVEQTLDAINKLNTTIAGLQQAQANSNSRTDNLATQVQALVDNLEEVKSRLGKLNQQVAETQGIVQSLDAKIAGGAQPAGEQPAAPPPSADVLYSNALRDFTGGKYDLARQQFLDYLKYYPDTDLASNAQFYLGEILYANREFKEAIAEYDKVLDNYPKSFKLADARLKKGMAFLELGQRASALRELREVVRRHPGTESARRASAKLRELGATVPSTPPRQ